MSGFLKSKIKYTLFLGIIAVSVILSCVFYNNNISRALEADNLVYFDEIASETAVSIGSRLGELLTSVRNYTYRFTGFDLLTEDEQIIILRDTADISQFQDIIFIDLEGNALSAFHSREFLRNRDYFLTASGENERANISNTIINNFTNERDNIFAAPIYTNGELSGVLAGVLNTEILKSMIFNDTFGGMATCYIVSYEGAVILRPDDNILGLEPGISLFETIILNYGTKEELLHEITAPGAQGTFNFIFDDESYVASHKTIGFNEWVAITVINTNDVLAFSSNVIAMTTVFTVVFMLLVLCGWLSWGIIYRILKNKHLTAVTERDKIKYVDTLTGGPSFEKFLADVREVFDSTPDDEAGVYAMISVDINKFRTVNDHLGYEEGGKILNKLANLIAAELKEDEFYSRRSADSFCILIKYEKDVDIFGRIETFINDTYYQIEEYKLILSFGVYKIDDLTMDIRSIIDRADLARKTIKGNNESSYEFFDENMLTKIREEKRIENIMEYALESNEFKVYLQPKYDLIDQTQIIGAEALVRWFRDGKMIPPGGFIPIFERNGFITKIDKFVFEEVCKQQKLWMNRKYDVRTISVNMSRMNLQETNFVRDLYEICNKYNVPTKYFEIEITESVAFENLETLTRVFNELKNYGFHISIDDFGTGYSSLNMLKNLPVDVLKIDRSFLSDTHNERANNIIHHVIELALSLHMKTICEGIETIEQVNLLSELKCDMAQGFYFARPMPIEEYEKLLYSDALAVT